MTALLVSLVLAIGAAISSDTSDVGTVPGGTLSGYATWYATPGRTAAVGPVLREALGGDPAFRGQTVTVCHGERCTRVRLTDWCACGSRAGKPTLLDLSTSAFRDLAPLSAGVIEVTIETGELELPSTDTGG